MYFPSQGFFLVLEMQKLTEQISSSQNTTRSSFLSRPSITDYSYLSDASNRTFEKEQFEKLNAQLEASTDLKFEFKAETNYFFLIFGSYSWIYTNKTYRPFFRLKGLI